jgi:hypothetical protein
MVVSMLSTIFVAVPALSRVARARQGAAHELRDAARRDADDDVALRDAQPRDAAGAFFEVVLDAFARAEHRVLAAGHDGLHEVRRGAERRRHLRGLDDAQAPARARADEKNPAALAQGADHDFDTMDDPLAFLVHGRDDTPILGVDQVDDVGDRHLVDTERVRVDGFCGQILPLRVVRHGAQSKTLKTTRPRGSLKDRSTASSQDA